MTKIIATTVAFAFLSSISFAEDTVRDTDNTGINKRDADHNTLTPEDQSNDPEDIKITQVIRQAVVKDESLSITAKNVKIITVAGAVTLRGSVPSATDKKTIAKLAAEAAPKSKITDQIEVEKEKE